MTAEIKFNGKKMYKRISINKTKHVKHYSSAKTTFKYPKPQLFVYIRDIIINIMIIYFHVEVFMRKRWGRELN